MTIGEARLPDGLKLVRTTPTFDENTVPAGLRAAHRIAEGVWGRLVVLSGSLEFVVEAEPATPHRIVAEGSRIIPPGVVHHVTLDGPVSFHIEFHR
jgi:tellurite resistance-related uncharacterized protein